MLELLILRSLFKRDLYRQYRSYITVSDNLFPILESIDRWYRFNMEDPIVEDIMVILGTLEDPDKEYAYEALDRCWKLNIPLDIETLLQQSRTAQIASKLALAAFRLSEGKEDLGTVMRIAKQLEIKDEQRDSEFVSQDLRSILQTTTGTPGLRWRLPWLNKSLGSLRKGDFGFVFARPETGKTTFLASECTNFASQVSGPVLWFNNEEQGNKVQLRCFQAALGCTAAQLNEDPERYDQEYQNLGGHNLKIVDNASTSARDVEAMCADHKPGLIVFDQIDKIKGFKNDREDLAMGAIYQWARELAKQYAPVIGVCQASGDAEGEPYLHMGHVSNARTAKQAEADFIIGIGKTHNAGEEYIRYFNISKNKLVGDADTDPRSRHGRQQILIRPDIGRYEEC